MGCLGPTPVTRNAAAAERSEIMGLDGSVPIQVYQTAIRLHFSTEKMTL